MPINITTESEPLEVKHICLTLYSNPGLGKTSLAFTASRPLLLDFDGGAYRAANRGDTVVVESWQDVASMTKEDLDGYDTVILDTVGKALEHLSDDILRRQSRLGYNGALNQQGWGQLGVQFRAFLGRVMRMGKDVILISHMDEKTDGDQKLERLKIPGQSQGLVLTDSDAIGRISIVDRRRYLIFNPTEASFGKDPAKLGAAPIPDSEDDRFEDYLARGIAKIKERLNQVPEERKGEVEWFKQHLPGCMDADAINALSARAKKAGRDVEAMLVKRADELGLVYDEATASWAYLEQLPEAPENESILYGDQEVA